MTYTLDEGKQYADSIFGSEDYYPMYDAIRDVDVAYFTEAGDRFLKLVEQQNIYASTYGYDNYWEYLMAENIYGYDERMPVILDNISEKFPRLLAFLLKNSSLSVENIPDELFDENEMVQNAFRYYGEIDTQFSDVLQKKLWTAEGCI